MASATSAAESFELCASIKHLERSLKLKIHQAAEQMNGGSYVNLSNHTVNEIDAIQAVIDDKTKRLAKLTLGPDATPTSS